MTYRHKLVPHGEFFKTPEKLNQRFKALIRSLRNNGQYFNALLRFGKRFQVDAKVQRGGKQGGTLFRFLGRLEADRGR